MVNAAKVACVVLSKVLLVKWGGFVEEVRVQTRSVRWEFGVPARTQINRHVVLFFSRFSSSIYRFGGGQIMSSHVLPHTPVHVALSLGISKEHQHKHKRLW
jgi:hypothetical protein